MSRYAHAFGPHAPEVTYVDHAHPEALVDLGEVQMNHATAGDPSNPKLFADTLTGWIDTLA